MEETIVPLQRVKKVIGLEVISSTQDLALELAQKGEPSATLVLACEQTAARRQDGTRFAADPQPFVLVGVGVNVNNRLPAREKESTSLKQIIGTETSKELFLDGLLDRFWTHYAHGFLAVR